MPEFAFPLLSVPTAIGCHLFEIIDKAEGIRIGDVSPSIAYSFARVIYRRPFCRLDVRRPWPNTVDDHLKRHVDWEHGVAVISPDAGASGDVLGPHRSFLTYTKFEKVSFKQSAPDAVVEALFDAMRVQALRQVSLKWKGDPTGAFNGDLWIRVATKLVHVVEVRLEAIDVDASFALDFIAAFSGSCKVAVIHILYSTKSLYESYLRRVKSHCSVDFPACLQRLALSSTYKSFSWDRRNPQTGSPVTIREDS